MMRVRQRRRPSSGSVRTAGTGSAGRQTHPVPQWCAGMAVGGTWAVLGRGRAAEKGGGLGARGSGLQVRVISPSALVDGWRIDVASLRPSLPGSSSAHCPPTQQATPPIRAAHGLLLLAAASVGWRRLPPSPPTALLSLLPLAPSCAGHFWPPLNPGYGSVFFPVDALISYQATIVYP